MVQFATDFGTMGTVSGGEALGPIGGPATGVAEARARRLFRAPEGDALEDAGRRARAADRLGRESRAQREALRAIDMQGGLALRRVTADGVRWATVDGEGGLTEKLPARTLEILLERGRLALKRFAFGGEVYAIA